MRKAINTISLALGLFLLFSVVAVSQTAPPPPISPPCGDPNNPFSPPCPIPVDGGVVFLIAAGLAYGGKKVHDLRKRS